jgi:hypothetical protein
MMGARMRIEMDEAHWLGCTDPQRMLDHLDQAMLRRKADLFAVACCRRIWHLLSDANSRRLVEAVERYADDRDLWREVGAAFDALMETAHMHPSAFACSAALSTAALLSVKNVKYVASEAAMAFAISCSMQMRPEDTEAMEEVTYNAYRAFDDAARDFEQAFQCELIRDIFGNPFQIVSFDPTWKTSRNASLARTIYDERRFSDMPLLADALEETGCRELPLLGHLRSGKTHVRGCWALDVLLNQGAPDCLLIPNF